MNHELPDVQAGFRKGRGTRDQIANIHHIIEKARVPEKHLFLLYWLTAKPLTMLCQKPCVVDQHKQKFWKMGIPDHLTCLLRNPYAGQEATVRTGHGKTDWFQIGKGVCQGWILSPCLFNLYAEYIMRNTGLEKAQLESRLPGEISITSGMQMTPSLWQKVKRNWKAFWWKWRRKVKKLAYSSTLRKLRSCHPVPSLHGK